jgi:hypothetical protein
MRVSQAHGVGQALAVFTLGALIGATFAFFLVSRPEALRRGDLRDTEEADRPELREH